MDVENVNINLEKMLIYLMVYIEKLGYEWFINAHTFPNSPPPKPSCHYVTFCLTPPSPHVIECHDLAYPHPYMHDVINEWPLTKTRIELYFGPWS